LTLIIVEHSQATQSAETSSGQSSQVSFGPGLGLLAFVPEIRVGGGDESKAGGRTTRGGSLTARMTTQVIDILPNGNLIIEGRQVILINGEEQELIVSGMVRPRDIQKDNTVLSTYLADAQIAFTGTGAIGDKQQPGILTRLFNWLF
ncbi:MAG: flagellar basal body L-ring protein FlgH, partial [Limnochordia bacterium]